MANMPMARRFCVPIMAAADGILENNEYFDIALDFFRPSPNRIMLEPNLTRVQINSMDGMINIVYLFRYCRQLVIQTGI